MLGLILLPAAVPAFSQATEQEPAVTPASPQPPADVDDRILGIIPNYQTIEDPYLKVEPLRVNQKFMLFVKETVDPFTFFAAAAGAGISQAQNDDPKYGQGGRAYAQRFGAAYTDIASQNFFSDALLASVLHEDPRYFRKGPEFPFWHRVGYAVSRVIVTRTDSGHRTFNFAGVGGVAMGIALSNAYYPPRSVSGQEVAERFWTSFVAAGLGNILPEFWPDIRQKILHRK